MDYLQAVESVKGELADNPEETVAVALQVALIAWRDLASHDAVWDQFGLSVVAAIDSLPGAGDIRVSCSGPGDDTPALRGAVRDLLAAAARQVNLTAAGPTPVSERLALGAAVRHIQYAAATLA